jgi:RNA polymerase sigma-70 factor (ECF subfamily)
MALKRFLAHERERGRAERRGGGRACLSFDTAMAEQRFQAEGGDAPGPDHAYDRQWALTLLGEVTARLEREYAAASKASDLRQLKPYLTAERGSIPYAEIALGLQTSQGAARVAVHRLRKRFRELFREVIAETVSGAEEAEEELRHVIGVLSRS